MMDHIKSSKRYDSVFLCESVDKKPTRTIQAHVGQLRPFTERPPELQNIPEHLRHPNWDREDSGIVNASANLDREGKRTRKPVDRYQSTDWRIP